MDRISKDGESVESYNEWMNQWEVWHCPRCGAKKNVDGGVDHSEFCPLR